MYLNVKIKDIRDHLGLDKLIYIEEFQKAYIYVIDPENDKTRYMAMCQYGGHDAEVLAYVKTEEKAIDSIYDKYIEDMNRYLVGLSDIDFKLVN